MISVLQYPFMTTGTVAAGMCFPKTSGLCSDACSAPYYGFGYYGSTSCGCGCNKTPFLSSYYGSLAFNNQGHNPVFNWILNGYLGQSQTVSPAYSTTYVSAQGKNRTLTDVVVNAIVPSQITATLAVGAVATFNINQAASVVSSNPATATASITGSTTTVTGVAAGTTTVVIRDAANNIVSTITITVA